MRWPRRIFADWFLEQITQRRRHYRRFVYNDPVKLKAAIQAGDVLLVEGDQRVSQAVKYLTTSTWSHSALYIGDALLKRNPGEQAPCTASSRSSLLLIDSQYRLRARSGPPCHHLYKVPHLDQ